MVHNRGVRPHLHHSSHKFDSNHLCCRTNSTNRLCL